MHMLDVDPFSNTFGPKAQRKRPKLKASTMDELANASSELIGLLNIFHFYGSLKNRVFFSIDKYEPVKDGSLLANISTSGISDPVKDPCFSKGQSKRIWSELYKVIDSSDVIIHVLDARDPMGTRCKNVETHIRKEASHKHLIFVLNKCDLVPTWVTVCIKKFLILFEYMHLFPPSIPSFYPTVKSGPVTPRYFFYKS
jgi:nuclear GTP-binding protein